MGRALCLLLSWSTSAAAGAFTGELPLVEVVRDNTTVNESCRIRFPRAPIPDADKNGVLRIRGDNLVIEFLPNPLRGALPGTARDEFTGFGVVVSGRGNLMKGAVVRGYRAGIYAHDADGLTVDAADVSDNFAQRLLSTPEREDVRDWLQPHQNDGNEWLLDYGAGVYVEDSDNPTLRGIRARRTQNGIILDQVDGGKIYDNDCSFLSGWGLAMWRSSRNLVSRNAFDFCIRGYSHNVYNRGQDSAGILVFEQCLENTFLENSATHGGDGMFAFAGREALGEAGAVRASSWYESRGHRKNWVEANDFSDAAAHGLELTFSFDNVVLDNQFARNAICGVWGGYSQRTLIRANRFLDNGALGYGAERGGINIEHGWQNWITDNLFQGNECGIFLWWDPDQALLELPWARVNEQGSGKTLIAGNRFVADKLAIELRQTTAMDIRSNSYTEVGRQIRFDDSYTESQVPATPLLSGCSSEAVGDLRPVGARSELAGRDKIVMTEWFPWDHESPLLRRLPGARAGHHYQLLGVGAPIEVPGIESGAPFAVIVEGNDLYVTPRGEQDFIGYEFFAFAGGHEFPIQGEFLAIDWQVTVFASPCDPRQDPARWREAAADGVSKTQTGPLELVYGMDAPGGLWNEESWQSLPSDHFGTIATATVNLPAGEWLLESKSDDGIRVWFDGNLVIDDWTWHAPRSHQQTVSCAGGRALPIRVEHFELDGYSMLQLDLKPAGQPR